MSYSATDNYLAVPRFWLNTYGHRAFSVAGPRGVDLYGTGGTCLPNIYEGGDIRGNVPPIF